jgi:hypothetical protein
LVATFSIVITLAKMILERTDSRSRNVHTL